MKHNTSKLSSGLAMLPLLVAASVANADGFSLGLSAARAPINLDDAGTTFGGDADGYRVFGSYMFTRNFGVEGGLSKYGTPDDTSVPADLHMDTEAYDLYAVAAYPLSNNFDLIAKVGYVSWNTETEVNDTNELRIYVFGNQDRHQAVLVAQLDNLGKGASGQAVQCLNIVLGFDEAAGLMKVAA